MSLPGPKFLDLPERQGKPRTRGLTHVLDKGLTPAGTEALLEQVADLIDIVKIGWGIGYIDPTVTRRIESYVDAGVPVCLGGTLCEIVAHQDQVGAFRDWALSIGITHVEVSNGLQALSDDRKLGLVKELSADFVVLAETGAKDGSYPTNPEEWAEEMIRDLEAGAAYVVAEGRESGTVGLYGADEAVHEEIVAGILDRIPPERIIFEAPLKAQQTWFITKLGAEVNLGNIEPSSVLPLETLRLGLRADTATAGPAP